MKIVIHRGTREIGGSCVELCSGNSRIVLDVGMPLVKPGGSQFDMREYAELSGSELFERGVLPRVDGLYEWQEPGVDGLLISHAHMDHYGLLGYVHPHVPVYISEETGKLLKVTKRFIKTTPSIKKPVVFDWKQPFKCGTFTVTPHLVDHSACGAYAFSVEDGEKRILYSGDLRDHGNKSKTFQILIHDVPKGIDALLMEGTMLGRGGKVQTEQELSEEAVDICRKTKGPVLVIQSGQNIDRLCSLFRAAKRTDRLFLVDPYVAYVLDSLYKPGRINIPTVSRNPKMMGVFYPQYLKEQGDIALRYGRDKIEPEEIAANRERVLMIIRTTMLQYLRKVHRHDNALTGGVILYSMWSGYREAPNMKTLLEWAEEQGLTVRDLHTSGHASIEALQRLASETQPKRIIPIHTFHKADYRKLFGSNVITLEDGEELEL